MRNFLCIDGTRKSSCIDKFQSIQRVYPFLVTALLLILTAQTKAQSTLEFDARFDASTVLQSFNSPNLTYSGALLGLRSSFSMISVNRVSTKTSILYGLSYARSGYNRGSFGLCGNSFDNLDPATIARIDENLRYDVEQVNHLSLPIGIRQTMKQGMKWTIYGQAMLEPMVYIYTKFENHNEEAQVNEVLERSSNAKNIQLATGLALGFERTIKDGWTVAFRPTLRMHLTNAAKHADFAEGDAKHVTMGVAVALGHSF